MIEFLLHSRQARFKRLVEKSQQIIEETFMAVPPKWEIHSSYGKDSIVLIDLVLSRYRVPIVFKDSGFNLPCVLATKAAMEALWGYQTEVIKGTTDYIEMGKEYGLRGVDRTETQQKKVVKMLKGDTLAAHAKAAGRQGIFWGMTKEESKKRRILFCHRGHTYQAKKDGLWYSAPLADWTTMDIWAYIFSRALPYPDLYDKETHGFTRHNLRNTGWATTDGAENGRITWLKHHYPHYFNSLAEHFPVLTTYA